MYKFFCFFLFPIFFSGCSYHFDNGNIDGTVTVPYVKGDRDGKFTAHLIRSVSSSNLTYANSEGDFVLEVDISEGSIDEIGFRYKRDNSDKRFKSIEPHERRLNIAAKVSLVENSSGRVLIGPLKVESSVDYDLDTYNSSQTAQSLGQLSPPAYSLENATDFLYKSLAEKIVDNINNVW